MARSDYGEVQWNWAGAGEGEGYTAVEDGLLDLSTDGDAFARSGPGGRGRSSGRAACAAAGAGTPFQRASLDATSQEGLAGLLLACSDPLDD